MYFSANGLQAMHQEVVNDCVRRSMERRMLATVKERTPKAPRRFPLVRALVHVLRGAQAYP